MRTFSLTPEQTQRLLRLIERGLLGEIDRLTIDFRDQKMYIDEWSRGGQTARIERKAA